LKSTNLSLINSTTTISVNCTKHGVRFTLRERATQMAQRTAKRRLAERALLSIVIRRKCTSRLVLNRLLRVHRRFTIVRVVGGVRVVAGVRVCAAATVRGSVAQIQFSRVLNCALKLRRRRGAAKQLRRRRRIVVLRHHQFGARSAARIQCCAALSLRVLSFHYCRYDRRHSLSRVD
jgi:hypothetical protein